MVQEVNPRLKALKDLAKEENIDIASCGDDISCIEGTIARVRAERSPTPPRTPSPGLSL